MRSAADIKAKARELGFEKVGVARAGRAPRAEFLRGWLADGKHGDMAYMARAPERREEPERLLPGAKAVVVVARNYQSPGAHSDDPRIGRVSRYAWGEDYHDVLQERLGELGRFIASLGGAFKACVDTNAILEKPWAQAAGLGWQGKHSNLISRDLGSWLFVGELLTDLDLEPDVPHDRTYCGSCTRCLDLCPTRAIVAPYVVDSRRCISYLTIEHRGWIDRELRPLMGNLIFGCDICQDVCPWNKFAKVSPDPAFHAREGNLTPPLIELLGLSREAWAARYKGSPIKRAKYPGFLRNVAIALGNSGDPEAVGALARALEHEEPLVRGHAAWALGRLGAREVLERRRPSETHPEVLAEFAAALA
jgi:epoxyqueuosine reductase